MRETSAPISAEFCPSLFLYSNKNSVSNFLSSVSNFLQSVVIAGSYKLSADLRAAPSGIASPYPWVQMSLQFHLEADAETSCQSH